MKLSKMLTKGLVPKITWASMTGFEKLDLGLGWKPKRRRKMTIKKILKDI